MLWAITRCLPWSNEPAACSPLWCYWMPYWSAPSQSHSSQPASLWASSHRCRDPKPCARTRDSVRVKAFTASIGVSRIEHVPRKTWLPQYTIIQRYFCNLMYNAELVMRFKNCQITANFRSDILEDGWIFKSLNANTNAHSNANVGQTSNIKLSLADHV